MTVRAQPAILASRANLFFKNKIGKDGSEYRRNIQQYGADRYAQLIYCKTVKEIIKGLTKKTHQRTGAQGIFVDQKGFRAAFDQRKDNQDGQGKGHAAKTGEGRGCTKLPHPLDK